MATLRIRLSSGLHHARAWRERYISLSTQGRALPRTGSEKAHQPCRV